MRPYANATNEELDALKVRLTEATDKWLHVGMAHFGKNTPDLNCEILFDVKGTTAGWAMNGHTIRYNLVLAYENGDEFFGRTVPHEVAHIVDTKIHGNSSHGLAWQYIMEVIFRRPATRCHSYETASVRKLAVATDL